MNAIRQRVPFKFTDSPEDIAEDELRILDEQEQDEVIQSLRKANDATNRRYMHFLWTVVGCSCFLQLLGLFFSVNPLSILFHSDDDADAVSRPFSFCFGFLNIYLHASIVQLVDPDQARFLGVASIFPSQLKVVYSLAGIAPSLCVCLQQSWQHVLWWSSTVLVISISHMVRDSITQGNKNISEVESLRYRAPGA